MQLLLSSKQHTILKASLLRSRARHISSICTSNSSSNRNSPICNNTRSNSTIASASSTATAIKNQKSTYAAISKTLYKQILRWTKTTGDVPFDPIPPLTLLPPLIDKTSLEKLALALSKTAAAATTTTLNTNEEEEEEKEKTNANEKKEIEDYKMLVNLLPSNSIVNASKLVIPIEDAKTVKNITRLVYALNHNDNHVQQQQQQQLDNIKERVSLGFDVLQSLNQLSEMLDERKESREMHGDRNGVLFHVGQVVQHKTLRWRAIVAGWDKYKYESTSKSSLTTKEYGSSSSSSSSKDEGEAEAEAEAENQDGNGTENESVEYTVFLDEGDAVLSRARVLGSKKVKQHDLQIVVDPHLKRVRCSTAGYLFENFDSYRNEFNPGNILSFEYPNDNGINIDIDIGNDSITNIKVCDNDTVVDVDVDADIDDSMLLHGVEDILGSNNVLNDAAAKLVTHQVKELASQLQNDILDLIPDTSSNSSSNPIEGGDEKRHFLFISDIKEDLESITKGELKNSSDILTSSTTTPSSQKVAVAHLNAILNIIQRVTQLMWHRRTSLLHKDRAEFQIGTIVRHKKYDFRGVVAGWDAYPRTDVSRWDGLQDMKGDVKEMPFYHVIADSNDTARAFGQERRFRYVCQENLESCSESNQFLDLDLDDGWTLSRNGNTVEYIAPDQVKFQHAEKLDKRDEGAIEKCMNGLLSNVTHFMKNIRNRTNQNTQENTNEVHLDQIFNLLENADCLEDAYVVEEFIKEIWKVHETPEMRWALEDGTEALLRGDKLKALNIFEDIIENQDPEYLEAYNKKATCYYMLGDMKKSIEAAELACEMEPRHFQAFAGLGLAYNDITQYTKATKYFRTSLRLQPWSPVSSRLSVCLDLLNRLELQEDGY